MTLRRALLFSYIEKYGSYVIGLIATMIISRILGPGDIGAFSVGAALVGMIAVLREIGVSTYVVQEVDLTARRIRTAFTLTVAVGGVLALGIWGASGPAGALYRDPRVATIVAVLALGFALTPIGSVAQSLLARELAFGKLAVLRLSQSLTVAIVGVALAAYGIGPVSLAWAVAIGALTNSALSLWMRPHAWLPTFSGPDLKRVFGVGVPATASSIIDNLANALPELVLGRTQDMTATGLFSRARGLSDLAHQVLARTAGPVVFSALAEERRQGRSLAPLYLRSTLCVTALGWAALGVMAVLAEPLVYVLYGAQWSASVPLIRWLCVAAMALLLTAGAPYVLLAASGAVDILHLRLAWLPVHLVCLFFGSLQGAEGIAVGMVVSGFVSSALHCLWVRKRAAIGFRDHLRIVRSSAFPAIASLLGAAPALLVPGDDLVLKIVTLAVGGSGAAIGFAVALYLGSHPLKEEFARLLARVIPNSRRASASEGSEKARNS